MAAACEVGARGRSRRFATAAGAMSLPVRIDLVEFGGTGEVCAKKNGFLFPLI